MGAPGSGRKPAPITPTNLGAARTLEMCAAFGMRFTDVARSLSIDVSNLRRVLNGERGCTLSLAVQLEDMFGIPPRDWLEPVKPVEVIQS